MRLQIASWLKRRAGARVFPVRFIVALPLLAQAWVAVAVVAVVLRTIFSPGHASIIHAPLLLAALVMPALALQFSLSHVMAGRLFAQPDFRFARVGRWRELNAVDCASVDHYGTAGLLAMLLAGLLLNIPVRAAEFLAAMPTPSLHAPGWYLPLYTMMLVDLALLSSCYAALVGFAVRRVPIFPRLLVGIWLLDLLVQFLISGVMSMVPHVPPTVNTALASLLSGNVKKVMISMAIWIPYLLLSPRVNLTYRYRIPA